MPTPAFITIDTEFAWRHHAAGLGDEQIYARSIEPAGVGIGFQLARLAEHGLKACFFVDPMPAVLYGLDPIRRIVDTILDGGQEVQLHLHPGWTGAAMGDRGRAHARVDLNQYDAAEQRDLLRGAFDLLVAAGAPPPVAFRAGSYAANDDTLAALAAIGIRYDSSHNGAVPASRIGLPRRRISPTLRDVVEVPVSVIEDAPGSLRTFQLCALSSGETYDALEHAAVAGHACVTMVSHGFELSNRAGTRANGVHVRRFEALCRMLADMRGVLPTMHFADQPTLPVDRDDRPLSPDRLRTRWRQAEQLWSNWVEERVA